MYHGEEGSISAEDTLEGGEIGLKQFLRVVDPFLLEEFLGQEGREDIVASFGERGKQGSVEVLLQLHLIGLIDGRHEEDGARGLGIYLGVGRLTREIALGDPTGGEEE